MLLRGNVTAPPRPGHRKACNFRTGSSLWDQTFHTAECLPAMWDRRPEMYPLLPYTTLSAEALLHHLHIALTNLRV